MATAEQTQDTPDQISTLIDSTREQFEAQMEELRPQHEAFLRLERIVENFDKVVTGTTRKGRTTRASGGASRPDEFLRLVTEAGAEGITVSEAADKMDGMNPNYLYRIAKELMAVSSIIKGEDKRYRAA